MEKQFTFFLVLGILIMAFSLLSTSAPNSVSFTKDYSNVSDSSNDLKEEALNILNTKCNVCHRKKSPFMVFNEKNMGRRARKIYKAVFVDRSMPDGEEVSLTAEEYDKLEEWLLTQDIN